MEYIASLLLLPTYRGTYVCWRIYLPTPIADGFLARTRVTLQLRIESLDGPFRPTKLPQKSGEKGEESRTNPTK